MQIQYFISGNVCNDVESYRSQMWLPDRRLRIGIRLGAVCFFIFLGQKTLSSLIRKVLNCHV